MLDIEESTSRSQYTRAKAMLEQILVQKKIIFRPQKQGEWVAAAHARF
jgi:RNA polymerase sigma-70 factor (ECF subfamily)